jgi:hypothetical protein
MCNRTERMREAKRVAKDGLELITKIPKFRTLCILAPRDRHICVAALIPKGCLGGFKPPKIPKFCVCLYFSRFIYKE